MPSVNHFYTNDTNPGSAPQVFIGHSNLSGANAEPVAAGRMEVVDKYKGRTLLYNPLTGHYWDDRGTHGRFIVEAQRDPQARRIFRGRRW